MDTTESARDVLDLADDLDDQGVTEYQALLAEINDADAAYQAERAAKAQRAAALEQRFAEAAAERQRAEQFTAEREARRAAEARAAEIEARNEELTAALVEHSNGLVAKFYAWLDEAPPVDGPARIIRRTDPVYPGAVAAMINNCNDPRLRQCRIPLPPPLRFA